MVCLISPGFWRLQLSRVVLNGLLSRETCLGHFAGDLIHWCDSPGP